MKNIINYSHQSIDNSDIKQVSKILKSHYLTQGPALREFESKLKSFFNAKSACCVSSGTAALYLLGKVLNWKKNDLIITTPFTFSATANSIVVNGAKPLFCDIKLSDFNLDPNQVEHMLNKYNKYKKKIKAIVAVDYAGNPCDWKNLNYLSKKFSVNIINDNCHAMGSKYYGNSSYAIKYADFVTQSFHPLKNITTCEGGAVITNKEDISKKIANLRNHGIYYKESQNILSNDLKEVGYNYRMSELHAALGLSQIKKVKKFINKKKQIAKRYDSFFSQYSIFDLPIQNTKGEHSYHLYPLLINFKKIKKNKLNFLNFLSKRKIFLQVHYKPIHLMSYYKKNFGYKTGDFPNAEEIYSKIVSLPIYPNLKISEQRRILKLIKFFFKGYLK